MQTVTEDVRYAHFRQLLKVGVPRQNIENDMRNQGLNPDGLDGIVSSETSIAPAQAPTPIVTRPGATVRRRWYFTEVPERGCAPPPPGGTIWSSRSRVRQLPDVAHEWFDRLFVKAVGGSDGRSALTNTSTDGGSESKFTPTTKQGSVMLLKREKALTVEIALKTLKTSFSDVAEEIKFLSGSSLEETAIKTILSMWPSVGEQRGLDEYSGHPDSLGKCEQFFIIIRKVPRVEEKLWCLLLKKEFPERVHELREVTLLVIRALNQLCTSSKFEELLVIILNIGNYVNWGEDDKKYRSSFSLESLVTLTHTKCLDGSLTLLDAIVDSIQAHFDFDIKSLLDEIKLISLCKAVSVDALQAEMEQLGKGYEMLVAESRVAVQGSSSGNKDAERSRQALSEFASIVKEELGGVQKLFDDLEESVSAGG
ncbi:putative aarF domain-containing protein kinase 4 [Phytophthora boehmeriae]|uniref:Putative aarF domain-containing protein kinase 4 n=1 Tax=Phytophthora boehmeriae TaxID=109152 RepID=A0A8T1WX30_9STRA|nr:putative aarF domain-containing protein kinase 4 [Phytophthora boehmeriae]